MYKEMIISILAITADPCGELKRVNLAFDARTIEGRTGGFLKKKAFEILFKFLGFFNFLLGCDKGNGFKVNESGVLM